MTHNSHVDDVNLSQLNLSAVAGHAQKWTKTEYEEW